MEEWKYLQVYLKLTITSYMQLKRILLLFKCIEIRRHDMTVFEKSINHRPYAVEVISIDHYAFFNKEHSL